MSDDIFVWMGGSFSPPTIAHIDMAALVGMKLARDTMKTIRVFFVPVNDYYRKKSVNCVTAKDRITMLRFAVEYLNSKQIPNVIFNVSTYEIDEANDMKDMKTYESIKQFPKLYGASKDNIYLCLGEDNLTYLLAGKWAFSYDILLNNKIICIPRSQSRVQNSLFNKIDIDTLNKPESSETPITDPITDENVSSRILSRITFLDVVPRVVSSTNLRKIIRSWNGSNDWASRTGILNSTKTSSIKPIIDYIIEHKLYRDVEACETTGGTRNKTRKISRRGKKFNR